VIRTSGTRMQVTSEGPTKITKATIEAAWRRRKNDHRLIVRDAECRGLALVVNPTTPIAPAGPTPLRDGAGPTGRSRWATPKRTRPKMRESQQTESRAKQRPALTRRQRRKPEPWPNNVSVLPFISRVRSTKFFRV